MRCSPRLEEALPVLLLHGLSTGDFSEALAALFGLEAAGFSATTITPLLKELARNDPRLAVLVCSSEMWGSTDAAPAVALVIIVRV